MKQTKNRTTRAPRTPTAPTQDSKQVDISELSDRVRDIFNDPVQFISRLSIVNKFGKIERLRPNSEQIEIIRALQQGNDTIVLKPRQIGSSTIVCAYMFYVAYTSTSPITTAILSHKIASSKHLLQIHKRFYKYLPKQLQKPVAVDNTTELTFKDGGSIIAVASTQSGGMRSFTCSMLHISEYAFAEDPEELKATALAALNGNQLIIESTANHYNDCLWQEIHRYIIGEARWTYLFFAWYMHEEYMIEDDDISEITDEEEALIDLYGITKKQIAWRREKISKIGYNKFIREYPTTLDEAYRIQGSTYFTHQDFMNMSIHTVEPTEWVVFENPNVNDSYAIGVDIGGGVGRDYSVVFCCSKLTGQPVCLWRSNMVSPIALVDYIMDMSATYNNALVLVESNNYGMATINELLHQGFGRLWKTEDGKDFLTTSKTKPLIFENLRKGIQSGYINMIDNITAMELRSITVDDKGIIKFADNLDSHSDSAMAMALAYYCLDVVRLKQVAYLPDWIKSRKADKIRETSGAMASSYRRY